MRHGNVIPKDASYYCRAEGKYYEEGEIMPNPQTGDIYRFGDYEYAYNLANTNDMETDFDDDYWKLNEAQNGWGVKCTVLSQPSEMLSSINGEPITCIDYAFHQNHIMTESPSIPDTVISAKYAYCECQSLIKAPQLPIVLENMEGIFMGCVIMREYEGAKEETAWGDFSGYHIPEGVEDIDRAFCRNRSVTVLPDISKCNWLQKLQDTFSGMSSLKDISDFKFPENVKDLTFTWANCYNIQKLMEKFPEGIEVFDGTFMNNVKLEKLCQLPETAKNIIHICHGCTNLKDIEKLPDEIEEMDWAFAYTAIETPANAPKSIRSMDATYTHCYNLTDIPDFSECNQLVHVDNMCQCCPSLVDISHRMMPASIDYYAATFSDCRNLESGPVIGNPDAVFEWAFHNTKVNVDSISVADHLFDDEEEFNFETKIDNNDIVK